MKTWMCIAILVLTSCHREDIAGRESFAAAKSLIAEEKWEAAATKLTEAIADADADDGALLFAARYQLGYVYGKQGDAAIEESPEKAAGLYRTAASFFANAARTRPHSDAREQQRIAHKKMLIATNKLNGTAELTKMIEALIKKQVGLRQQLASVALSAELADDKALDETALTLGNLQRLILAETGAALDVAQAQVAAVVQDPNDKESAVKAKQFELVAAHLGNARSKMGEHRLDLRARRIKAGFESSSDAVSELFLALESLLDPQQRLRLLASQQAGILKETQVYIERNLGEDFFAGGAQNQKNLQSRTESLALLLAAVDASQFDESDPQALMARQLMQAEPHVQKAALVMADAAALITQDKATDSLAKQTLAMQHLADALEALADLRTLVELTATTHKEGLDLFASKTASEAEVPLLEKTRGRLTRMQALIEYEKNKAISESQQSTAGQAPAKDPAAVYDKAEELRQLALAGVEATISARADRDAAFRSADETQKHLDELRLLFANIVEHLKVLKARETELRDDVLVKIDAEPLQGMPFSASQQELANTAEGLTKYLEEIADGEQGNDEQKQKYAEAAGEMRLAISSMLAAQSGLRDIGERAGHMSVNSKPVLDEQQQSIDSIANAIEILSPKDQNKPNDGDQGKQGDDNEKQNDSPQPKQQQPKSLGDVLQDQEQRKRQKQQQGGGMMPPEKDW